MTRVVEAVAPRRLGTDYRWLLASATVNNIGDGVAIAAGPLLVAAQTSDPFLVSLALLAQVLPALLFGVLGGAVADRFERRRLVVVVNLVRSAVLPGLVATIVTGQVDIVLVLVALFLLGTAETFADPASGTLVPNLVPRADLGIANARLQGALLLMNQLIAPPIGAALFAIGMALPFATNAVAFALGAVLVSRIRVSVRPERRHGRDIVGDMKEGIRWLVGHKPMRTLALTICASTSRSGRHGASSCSTPASAWAWTHSGSGCSRPRWPWAASLGPRPTGRWSVASASRTSCAPGCSWRPVRTWPSP